MQISYRNKLVGSFILVIAATGITATLVGAYLIGERVVTQAQAKVTQDINSARMIYEHEVARLRDLVRLNANRPAIQEGVAAGDAAVIRDLLGRVSGTEGVDLLLATDAKGTVLARARPGAAVGYSLAGNPAIRTVLETGEEAAGTEVIDPRELRRHSPDLAERARIALVPTPRARPTERVEEARGMAIVAAAPVWGPHGRMAGVVFGGRLLNRTEALVDSIRDTVYRGEVYEGRETGTATLFLGDVRVATTVRSRDGTRAIGTRVQAEVGDRVLVHGKPWNERAFVVNGWYLTAYEPIRDLSGKVVGILYVGMREDKFVALRRGTVIAFLAVTLGSMALAGLIAYALARSVLRPIRQLVTAAREISAGNFAFQVPEASRDEIGSLERAFNRMTDAIRDRDRKIKEQAGAQARAMLAQSDRLGALGRLAAGVVHEINNPLTGILTLLKMERRILDEDAPPFAQADTLRSYLDLAQSETVRCSRIVTGLLDFSRQSKLELAEFDVGEMIERTLRVIEHQLELSNVKVERHLDPAVPRIRMDIGKIQQCLLNMVINAQQAMPDGGTLRLSVWHIPLRDEIVIEVADTGMGIAPDNVPRVFDPFFTTKETSGLGLGLSVAYGIVQEHGGSIEVQSEVGKGTTFRIRLPVHLERVRAAAGKAGEEAAPRPDGPAAAAGEAPGPAGGGEQGKEE